MTGSADLRVPESISPLRPVAARTAFIFPRYTNRYPDGTAKRLEISDRQLQALQ